MHLADFDRDLYGSNGIVGGGLGIALGVALSSRSRRRPCVAVGFFGDGGANTGRVWEFVNLAALWKLPLIVVCENNQYAIVETHIRNSMAGDSISRRAEGFGLPVVTADGQDVGEMYRVTVAARQRAMQGGGPTFVETLTYRYEGHNTGDVQDYRTQDEVERWRAQRDPIARLRRRLLSEGVVSEADAADITRRVTEEVADSVDFAETSAWPDPSTVLRGVTAFADAAHA